jgi:hypothetical protein
MGIFPCHRKEENVVNILEKIPTGSLVDILYKILTAWVKINITMCIIALAVITISKAILETKEAIKSWR